MMLRQTFITMDLTANPLPKEHEDIIFILLKQHKNKPTVFTRENIYSITDNVHNVTFDVNFSHTVLLRNRSSNPDEYVLEAVANSAHEQEEESGAFGNVIDILATIRLSADQKQLIVHDKKRLVKIQRPKQMDDNHITYLMSTTGNELRHSKRVTHLHAKSELYDMTNPASFIVMRRMPGKKLDGLEKMPLLSRLMLTRELLYTLGEQVHAYGIVHCDVKPQNIIVNMENDKPTVKYIDYGLSKLAFEYEAEYITGTPLYIAPEQYIHNRNSYHADYYSLALTLCELWGSYLNNDFLLNLFRTDRSSYISARHHFAIHALFTYVRNVPKHVKVELKDLFHDMLSINQIDRPPIKQVIAKINQLIYKHIIRRHDPAHHHHILHAFQLAIKFNRLLHETAVKKQTLSVSDLHAQVSNDLDKLLLNNTGLATAIFIKHCRYIFPGNVHTASDVKNHFDDLFNTYKNQNQAFLLRKQFLENLSKNNRVPADKKHLFNKLIHIIHRIDNKICRYGIDIFSLADVNASLIKQLGEFDSIYDQLSLINVNGQSDKWLRLFSKTHEMPYVDTQFIESPHSGLTSVRMMIKRSI